MREKYLKMPPGWIIGTFKRELNLYVFVDDTLEDLQDRTETALVYWRQNHRRYPPARLWDIIYYDLLCNSFESRYEPRDWCKTRLQQLNNTMYVEEQWRKAEEEKRLAQEAELKRKCETPGTWEYYKAQCDEANRRAREVDAGGTTSETWPPPRSPSGNFPFIVFTKACNSL
jgi:hypothetical protein